MSQNGKKTNQSRALDPEEVRSWKERGFVEVPVSRKQGQTALLARNYLEKLDCYKEVREQLLNYRKASDVRRFIQQKHPEIKETTGSIDKYVQLYRKFFLAPMDYIRARDGQPENGATHDNMQLFARKIGLLPENIKQIVDMEEIASKLKTRLERLMESEDCGMHIPDLHKDVQAFTDINATILDKKMDLGQLIRIPRRVIGEVNHRYPDIDGLGDREREACLKVGAMAQEMLDMARGKNGTYTLEKK